MFIPLHDDAPLRRISAPFICYGVIGICCALFLASQSGLLPTTDPYLSAGFGIIPKVVLGDGYLPREIPQAPWWATPVTSLFLHGGWLHIAGNMLFLWVFGDNVEDCMGHLRFAVFFLLCGVMSALSHAAVNPESIRPLIGASGAISGVVAAYLLLYPKVRVWGLFLKYIPLQAPAWAAIGAWIAFQLFQGFFGQEAGVAWFAHIGGVAAGLMLTPFFVRRDVSIRERWR